MTFPLVTPLFLKDIVDTSKPAEENDFVEVIVSPAAVEYVAALKNPDVVRKLMSIEGDIEFKMAQLPENESEQFINQSRSSAVLNPSSMYYWQLRTLMMSVLQKKDIVFEKRLLLLNFAVKTIQGMINNEQPNLIPQFVASFSQEKNYDKTLEYFKSVGPSFDYSLADGISLLKSVVNSTPEYKDVMSRVYKNLGVSGPETLNMVDMKKYLEMRKSFSVDFMAEHSNWIEKIMINYVWTYSIPYAFSDRLNLWENFVFFCALYNAVKILVTCYKPQNEDEFVKAISSFDDALRRTGNDLVWKVVVAMKNAGQANNGDMAVLTLS